MITFTYIIGANIELFVKARIIPDDPEVNFEGGAEILSVHLEDGSEVETGGIYIADNYGVVENLEDLLECEALSKR